MNPSDSKTWFPAKRYGWGWGLPTAWQGWVVYGVYLLAVALIAWRVPPAASPWAFAGWVAVATGLLLWVCWRKGEAPHWRWGAR